MQELVYHSNYKIESSYWWFLARNKIISKVIKKTCNIKQGSDVLDAGCGTGGFAQYISPDYNVICLDTSPIALEYCKKRGLNYLYNTTLDGFPAEDWNVKAVMMLDVVEHIDDDNAVISEVYNILPEGGYFIASVPAYMWLWSSHDVMHMHKRRYTRKEFVNLLRKHGFEIEYSTYFNTFLFLPAAFKRFLDKIIGKKGNGNPVDEVPPFVNKLFTKVFQSESLFIPSVSFPFGLSILAIGRKTGK